MKIELIQISVNPFNQLNLRTITLPFNLKI